MWTAAFWKATAERVIASFIGAIIGTWGLGNGTGATSLDFPAMLNIGAGAAIFSLLKAILAAVSTDGGPSLTNAEVLTDKVAAKAVPNDKVSEEVPEIVAGPAAPGIPEDTPVDVVPENDPVAVSPVDTEGDLPEVNADKADGNGF